MPGAVIAREGYTAQLLAYVESLVARARLYTNDPDLDEDTVAADFVEPVMDGYNYLSLRSWTPPMLQAGRAFSVADPLIWTYTTGAAPAPIRGYYVVDAGTGVLLWAWRRPGTAFQFSTENSILTINVKMTYPAQ